MKGRYEKINDHKNILCFYSISLGPQGKGYLDGQILVPLRSLYRDYAIIYTMNKSWNQSNTEKKKAASLFLGYEK